MTNPTHYTLFHGREWQKLSEGTQILLEQSRPNRATRRKMARQNKKNRNS